MKTNYLMVRELEENFTPKTIGFISPEEHDLIKDTLCIAEMDIMALHNLRDFVVLYYDRKDEDDKKTLERLNKMSAIVCVIDKYCIIREREEMKKS